MRHESNEGEILSRTRDRQMAATEPALYFPFLFFNFLSPSLLISVFYFLRSGVGEGKPETNHAVKQVLQRV